MFRLVSVLIVAVLAVAGCTPQEGPSEPAAAGESDWDDDVREDFQQTCLGSSGGAEGYCGCALAGLEQTFTQAEFEALDGLMVLTHSVPEEFEAVVDACVAEHLDELMGEDLAELGQGRWSVQARVEFMNACLQTSGGLAEYCECTLSDMEERYSQSEFTSISRAIQRGDDVPAEYDAIVQDCLAEHAA